MPEFEYTAIDASGRRVAGSVTGASDAVALAEIEARKLVPVSLRPKAAARRWGGRGVPARLLAESYGQLGDLLRAGVPLLRALRLLGNRRRRPVLAACFADLAEQVSQGKELSAAMESHAGLIPPVHAAMVRAGERGGFLEAVLARLSELVAAQAELRAKLVGSLVYPLILVGVGALVLGVVLVVFVPQMRPLVAAAPDLPLVSRVVFWVSGVLSSWGLVLVPAAVVGGVGLWRLARTPRASAWLEARVSGWPVAGPLLRSIAIARFCRLLGTMLGNGIPLLSAMSIARGAAGHGALERAIARAAEEVRAGRALATPLGESGVFPEELVEMIAVGEAANNLDDVLVSIAQGQERRVDRLLGVAVRLIEPLLLVAIAAVVACVAAGLLLPMMSMRAGM